MKIPKLETQKRKMFNLPKVFNWDNPRTELHKSFLNKHETKSIKISL